MRAAILSLLVLSGTIARPAGAETTLPTASASRRNQVALGVALEHGLLTEIAYTRSFDADPVILALLARLAAPATPELEDGEVAAGVSVHYVHPSGFGVGGRAALTARWVGGELFDIAQGGLALALEGGWYGRFASAGAELAWEGSLLTHVTPMDRYRATAWDAADQWVGHAGGTLRAGVTASILAADVVLFGLKAGAVGTEALSAVPGFPFYASLSVGVLF